MLVLIRDVGKCRTFHKFAYKQHNYNLIMPSLQSSEADEHIRPLKTGFVLLGITRKSIPLSLWDFGQEHSFNHMICLS